MKQSLQINKEETIKFIMEEFDNNNIDNHDIDNHDICLFQKLFIISQQKAPETAPKKD